jgi:triosephosphate isomerase (TIM)
MSRTKVVAANWKMNLNLGEGDSLLAEIQRGLPAELTCEVIIAPPLTHLHHLAGQMSGIRPSAQNCHFAASGAFTGEVSVDMIKSVGAHYCITGHSERRQLFNESNEVVRAKVDAILKGGLTPIFCCGEALDIREAGKQNEYVRTQLEESIFHLSQNEFQKIIIAYEPIWAIGTGVTASPQQAQEMHAFIRQTIRDTYGEAIGDAMRILYGGSIKGDNAVTLFSQPDVDGGLVGGASLQAQGFLEIIRAAC